MNNKLSSRTIFFTLATIWTLGLVGCISTGEGKTGILIGSEGDARWIGTGENVDVSIFPLLVDDLPGPQHLKDKGGLSSYNIWLWGPEG